jgi:hypothetical protein
MNALLKIIDDNRQILIIFGVFTIYLLIQHAFVFMYFDDFGNASLTYINDKTYRTHSCNLYNIIYYMWESYKIWGGRILFHFFYVVLLQLGLFWIRLFQVAMILIISVSTYCLVVKNTAHNKIYTALLVCFLYGIINIEFARHGLYWFAASSIYVWPIAIFLLAVIFLTKNNQNYFFICLLFFIAGFSQEQIGASVVFFMIFYITYKYYTENKSFEVKNILALSASTIGYIILYLSPGSRNRMTIDAYQIFYEKNFIDRTLFNIYAIINTNISLFNIIWISILFITAVIAIYILIKSNPSKFSALNKTHIFVGIFIFILLNLQLLFHFSINLHLKVLFIMFIIVSLTSYLIYKKKYVLMGLFYSGIVSQTVMIMSPALPGRFVLINIFLSFAIIADVFSEFISLNSPKVVKLAIVSFVIVLSLINATSILYGYYMNSFPQRVNHEILERASQIEESGVKLNEITLLKQIDGLFGSVMPYEKIFIHYWIKDYYGLSIDINNFNWVDIYDIAQLPKLKFYVIDEIIPNRTQVGEDFQVFNKSSAIAIRGENFTRDCVVYFNEIPLDTTFGNSSFITAVVPSELYKMTIEYYVVVESDKYISNTEIFKVE